MGSNVSLQWLEQPAGALLMLPILLGVFLTVLYARRDRHHQPAIRAPRVAAF
jgi:hypothetical protein